MIITITAFTKTGYRLIDKIEEALPELLIKRKTEETKLSDWTRDSFYKKLPIVFVGATGIAVRTIAPFVSDKLTDSPCIVIDEMGEYVIPILSGHMGGANEIALMLAKAINAKPVITTATDVENKFSIDVFAKKNYLNIENRAGIKIVSGKLLENKAAFVYIEEPCRIDTFNKPKNIKLVKKKQETDIVLIPKRYVLGLGCKKGKTFEELKDFVFEELEKNNISIKEVCALCSIDLKAKEEGLNTLATFMQVPFITYTSEELLEVEGEFSNSDFVKNVTGVSNVCERAAMRFSKEAELKIKKKAANGMTFALAFLKEGRVTTWET